MKKEDIKIGDILFTVKIFATGNYNVRDVEVVDFKEHEEFKFLDILCHVLSDDEKENGEELYTHSGLLFKNKVEALEYVVSSLKDFSNGVTEELIRAKTELDEAIKVAEKISEENKKGENYRNLLLILQSLSERCCSHPLFFIMFQDGEFEGLTENLMNVIAVLNNQLRQANDGAEKILKEIYNIEEGKEE